MSPRPLSTLGVKRPLLALFVAGGCFLAGGAGLPAAHAAPKAAKAAKAPASSVKLGVVAVLVMAAAAVATFLILH